MAQEYGVTQNLLLQDNKNSMLLERNGKASSRKRTWHINIWYFFITDRINTKEVFEWCPNKKMVADFMTKPLQGSHFRRLCSLIMGMTSIKKAKNPSTSKSNVIKRDKSVKVRLLEGNKTVRKPVSHSSVKVLGQ
jgi:hypothetical protein